MTDLRNKSFDERVNDDATITNSNNSSEKRSWTAHQREKSKCTKNPKSLLSTGRKISSVNVGTSRKLSSVVGHVGSLRQRSTTRNSSTKSNVSVSDGMIVHSLPREGHDEDNVFYATVPQDLLQMTQGICRDFICYRLKRAGFQGRVVITKYPPAKDQVLSFQILKIGKIFEDLHPHLFRNLARQLGYVLRSNEEMRVLFERLAMEVIGPDPGEYRWGRVLALLSIAGSLSVDCIAQGHVDLIEDVVTVFCEFVESNLLHWIIDRGGWDAMVEVLHIKEGHSEASLASSLISSNAWIVTLTGILIISGLLLTMGALTKLFPPHKSVI